MTANNADTSKSLLTQLMIAGTAALAGSAGNAQIVVTNVNENIGFAPGDLSFFVSSLPGISQFEIYRRGSKSNHSIRIRSKIVGPTSSSAYLSVKAGTHFLGLAGSVEVAPIGKRWRNILGVSANSAGVVEVYHSTTMTGSSSSNTHTHVGPTYPSRSRFTDGYFAFKFTDSTRGYDYDYGWIKASLTDNTLDGLNLLISAYAYDSTGAQISMGDTGATVPEPAPALALAALSALTLGATGVKRLKALQASPEANR